MKLLGWLITCCSLALAQPSLDFSPAGIPGVSSTATAWLVTVTGGQPNGTVSGYQIQKRAIAHNLTPIMSQVALTPHSTRSVPQLITIVVDAASTACAVVTAAKASGDISTSKTVQYVLSGCGVASIGSTSVLMLATKYFTPAATTQLSVGPVQPIVQLDALGQAQVLMYAKRLPVENAFTVTYQ